MSYLDYSLTTSNNDELERDIDHAWNHTLHLMVGIVREHRIDPLTVTITREGGELKVSVPVDSDETRALWSRLNALVDYPMFLHPFEMADKEGGVLNLGLV